MEKKGGNWSGGVKVELSGGVRSKGKLSLIGIEKWRVAWEGHLYSYSGRDMLSGIFRPIPPTMMRVGRGGNIVGQGRLEWTGG